MATKFALVKFHLNIQGLYYWGKGWLVEPDPEKPSYPARWNEMCRNLMKDGPYQFKECVMRDGDTGSCEQLLSSNFYAYMHGMDVAGHYLSSEYCPGDNDRAEEVVKKAMTELLAYIRKTFPERKITAQLNMTRYDIDPDKPTAPLHWIQLD